MTLINKYILAYLSLWQYLVDFSDSFFRLGQTAWIMTIMIFFMGCLLLYEFIKEIFGFYTVDCKRCLVLERYGNK